MQPPFFRLERHKTIYGISLLIKAGCERVIEGDPLWVGCEAPHIGLDPSAGLSVAMTTGKMIGPLEEKADHGIILILPGEWRSQILGLKRTTKRDDAKVISLSEIPKYVEGLSEILATTARIFDCEIDKLDHVTDAAGVGLSTIREATLSAQEGRDGHTKKRKRRSPKPDPTPASAIIPVVEASPAAPKKGRSRKIDRG